MTTILPTLLLLAALVFSTVNAGLVVDTPLGSVKGIERSSAKGKSYVAFEGIPYAEPPVGSMRFERPVPKKPWTGVLDTVDKHVDCIQADILNRALKGTEDCLVLSVATQNLPSEQNKDLKPVYVWIHGGGFNTGSGNKDWYGLGKFMDHDIVMVSINYRLGPFGFLTTGSDVMPANRGLWDQIEALKWVQKNIKSFGGDPNKVTIGGESAGSMSVMALYFSPEAKGLFHGAIAQSGTMSSSFCHQEKHPLYFVKELASTVNCNPDASHEDLKKCLEKITPEKMAEPFMTNSLPEEGVLDFDLMTLLATHDDFSSRPVVPKDPYEQLMNPSKLNVNDVPLMIGNNKDEGLLFVHRIVTGGKAMAKKALDKFDHYASLLYLYIGRDDATDYHKEQVQMLNQKYFGQSTPKEEGFVETICEIASDRMFVMSGMVTSRKLAENIKSPVYEYLYTHSGSFRLFDLLSLKPYQFILKMAARWIGWDLFTGGDYVTHADELFLMFNSEAMPFEGSYTAEDKAVTKRLLTMWTNFVKTGDPNKPEPIETTWTPLSSSSQKWLQIGTDGSRMVADPYMMDKYQFWLNTFFKKFPPTIKNPNSPSWKNPSSIKLPTTSKSTNAKTEL